MKWFMLCASCAMFVACGVTPSRMDDSGSSTQQDSGFTLVETWSSDSGITLIEEPLDGSNVGNDLGISKDTGTPVDNGIDSSTTSDATFDTSVNDFATDVGTSIGGKLCAPCTKHADCGGDNDYCLRNPDTLETLCGQDCSIQPCPTDFDCQALSWQGMPIKQCVPMSKTCQTFTDGGTVKTDSGTTVDSGGTTGTCGNAFETELLKLDNQVRGPLGLSILQCDPVANKVAHDYAQRMCDEGFTDHVAPDGSTPSERLLAGGGTFQVMTEIIAAGSSTPDHAMFTAWKSSPAHWSKITSDKWTHVGPGYVSCPKGWYHYWVQVFVGK